MRSPFDAGPQPGGRPPAPGRLALVQAFVNSSYDLERDHGTDLLADPRALRDWAAERGLVKPTARVTRADHERAIAVREGLRALLVANNGGPLDASAAAALEGAAPVAVSLAGDGPRLEPVGAGIGAALGLVVGTAAAAMLEGTWPRLKACRQHDCRWAFYDHSRNGAGSWCSMSVCGGRAKQRAYYRRNR